MAHRISLFDVTNVTLSKPMTQHRDDGTPFKTQDITVEARDGNINLTLFLKD